MSDVQLAQDAPTGHAVEVTTGWAQVYGVWINPSAIAFALIIVLIMVVLWRANRAGKFPFFDILREDGKGSWTRTIGLLAFIITGWVLFDREIKGLLTIEWYAAFGGLWVAPILTKIIKGQPPSTVA